MNRNFMNSKRTFLTIFLCAAAFTAAVCNIRGDGDEGGRKDLAGTWFSTGAPGVAPGLVSFTKDGRVMWSRPITVIPAPGLLQLTSAGHGEWIRTGHDEFTCTVFFLSSTTTSEFTTLIKLIQKITLNADQDSFTETGTLTGYDPAGNKLFSFPSPNGSGKRMVVER